MSTTATLPDHIIENFDDVLEQLIVLASRGRKATREFKFEVGDLINEKVPPGITSPYFTGETFGLGTIEYQKYLERDLDTLIERSGLEFSHQYLSDIRGTCRAFPMDKRYWDVAFTTYIVLRHYENRFEVMHDGMSVGQAYKLLGRRSPNDAEHERREAERSKTYNRTQRLRAGVSQFLSVKNHISQNGDDPLTNEEYGIIAQGFEALEDLVAMDDY